MSSGKWQPFPQKTFSNMPVMMTSSNGNIFHVTGHLWGEFTGCRWIPPHKGQWRGALTFSLICVWINGWVNNREAGDLRRYRTHHDVIVMWGQEMRCLLWVKVLSLSPTCHCYVTCNRCYDVISCFNCMYIYIYIYILDGEILCFTTLQLFSSGIILCMGSANERRRYSVTSPLIGWAHTQNDLCFMSQCVTDQSFLFSIWVTSQNCDCHVTWFCYQLIAKPGNKTATVSWPDPYIVQFHYNTVQYNTLLHTAHWWLNTLRLSQNGCHFPDNIFKCIFSNENVKVLIKISLKFVPKGPINNIPALVQIMAWRWPGDKPLSESMMVSLLTHICITQPQWVKSDRSSSWVKDIYCDYLEKSNMAPWTLTMF